MNFIHIAGNLGADPEVRFTSSGKKVTTFKIATRSRRGKAEDQTIWFRVTVWGEQFDKMISFLKKGSSAMVYGDLHKPEIFTDREGKPQVSLEITAVHLEFSPFGKGSSSTGGEQQNTSGAGTASSYAQKPVGAVQGMGETFDDEVPF